MAKLTLRFGATKIAAFKMFKGRQGKFIFIEAFNNKAIQNAFTRNMKELTEDIKNYMAI